MLHNNAPKPLANFKRTNKINLLQLPKMLLQNPFSIPKQSIYYCLTIFLIQFQ